MGADLTMTTWFTSSEIDMKTVLNPAEFEKSLKTVLKRVHIQGIYDFLEDCASGHDSSFSDNHKDRLEEEKDARDSAFHVLADGYKELRQGLTDFHRYITFTSVGEVTVWMSGGLSWGDDPWEGFSSLSAILDSRYYIDDIRALIPWIVTPSANPQFEDTDKPRATGIITSHAASIMKHAALTHNNPDVRIGVVKNLAVVFTADELTILSQDDDENVARAASDRVIAATLIDAREPSKG